MKWNRSWGLKIYFFICFYFICLFFSKFNFSYFSTGNRWSNLNGLYNSWSYNLLRRRAQRVSRYRFWWTNRFLESTILRSSRTSWLLYTLFNTFLQLHRTFNMPMSSFFAAYLKCCEKEWSDITHCNIGWGSLTRGVEERKERYLSIGIYTEVHTVGNSKEEGLWKFTCIQILCSQHNYRFDQTSLFNSENWVQNVHRTVQYQLSCCMNQWWTFSMNLTESIQLNHFV